MSKEQHQRVSFRIGARRYTIDFPTHTLASEIKYLNAKDLLREAWFYERNFAEDVREGEYSYRAGNFPFYDDAHVGVSPSYDRWHVLFKPPFEIDTMSAYWRRFKLVFSRLLVAVFGERIKFKGIISSDKLILELQSPEQSEIGDMKQAIGAMLREAMVRASTPGVVYGALISVYDYKRNATKYLWRSDLVQVSDKYVVTGIVKAGRMFIEAFEQGSITGEPQVASLAERWGVVPQDVHKVLEFLVEAGLVIPGNGYRVSPKGAEVLAYMQVHTTPPDRTFPAEERENRIVLYDVPRAIEKSTKVKELSA